MMSGLASPEDTAGIASTVALPKITTGNPLPKPVEFYITPPRPLFVYFIFLGFGKMGKFLNPDFSFSIRAAILN
jgi:hypothetical protein